MVVFRRIFLIVFFLILLILIFVKEKKIFEVKFIWVWLINLVNLYINFFMFYVG